MAEVKDILNGFSEKIEYAFKFKSTDNHIIVKLKDCFYSFDCRNEIRSKAINVDENIFIDFLPKGISKKEVIQGSLRKIEVIGF